MYTRIEIAFTTGYLRRGFRSLGMLGPAGSCSTMLHDVCMRWANILAIPG